MRTRKDAAEEVRFADEIHRTLSGDGIARWKLATLMAAYLSDTEMDAVDLRVQLELWANAHAKVMS